MPRAAISVATKTGCYPLKLFITMVLSYWFLSPWRTRAFMLICYCKNLPIYSHV